MNLENANLAEANLQKANLSSVVYGKISCGLWLKQRGSI
jgi:uncharacterized protein YjbI with pentapeptide repeats